MRIYRVNREGGDYTLVEAHDIRSARKFVREEWGRTASVQGVATHEEIEWHNVMSGYPIGLRKVRT